MNLDDVYPWTIEVKSIKNHPKTTEHQANLDCNRQRMSRQSVEKSKSKKSQSKNAKNQNEERKKQPLS